MKRLPVLLVAFCAVTLSSATQAAGDAGEIVRQAIRRHDIQAEMPVPQPRAASWLDWFKFDISADTARLLLWGAVILGVAVTIWSLRDSLPAFSRSRRI
ncbi:MAG: hypothetical protein LCH80_02190, partial [Proteobacteria bacterium]|nr:hypothetical protein [Pseudomonadota bacterium]